MTSLFTTTSTRQVPKSKSASCTNNVVGKNEEPQSTSTWATATTNNSNNNPLAITSIGETILRNFERISSIIDESLDSDTLIPSLCHKQEGNNNCVSKFNETSITSADDTTLSITGETSQENSFILSPASLANECNLNFASWLQSQECDASGILSHGDNTSNPNQSLQFSRDEFLEARREEEDNVNEYVSISEHTADKRNRNIHLWPPKLPLAVTDVWDSIVSSNWKCWQQHDIDNEAPMNDNPYKLPMVNPCRTTQLVMNPTHPNNRNKDSSYTVDALEGEIPIKLLSTKNDATSSQDHLCKDDINKEVDKLSTSINITGTQQAQFCEDASQQAEQQGLTSSRKLIVEDIVPSMDKGIIGDFVWQENSQLPVTTTTPSPSLAGSSLIGEDITMASNHSCTYSASPARAESSIRSRNSIASAALPPNKPTPPQPEEDSPQVLSPEVSEMISTVAATMAIDEFDDSFPAV